MLIFPFLKSLSFAKILNLIKIFFSYAISTAFKIPFAWGLPVIINIEPTNLCNLSCLHCPTGAGKLSRKTGYMDNGFLENIISQIQKHSIAVQLYFQGEPFLNKNLLEFIKIIKENHNFLIINTNGHFFEETVYLKKLVHLLPDKIIISLDGATEETYKVYRKNGDFNKVVNGIKNIVSVKKELGLKLPRIVMQFIVMKHNEQEIDQVKEMSENLGVDKLELKTAQLYDWHEIKDFIPDDRKYSRYIRAMQGPIGQEPRLSEVGPSTQKHHSSTRDSSQQEMDSEGNSLSRRGASCEVDRSRAGFSTSALQNTSMVPSRNDEGRQDGPLLEPRYARRDQR